MQRDHIHKLLTFITEEPAKVGNGDRKFATDRKRKSPDSRSLLVVRFRPRISPATKHRTVELLVWPDNILYSILSFLFSLYISLMPRSHKRRAVLRAVTRQFRHLTLRVLAGFSRLTSMQRLCLRPRRPQRASRASEQARPHGSPLVHSSSTFHRLSSSPRRPTFPGTESDPVLRGLTASISFSFLLHDQAA